MKTLKSLNALSFEQLAATGGLAVAEKPLDVPALLATTEALLVEAQTEGQDDRVCNHRADFRHMPRKEPDSRELIHRRAMTSYVYSPPTSRWGLNE
ncbi:MAG: hypothetical protein ACXW3Z_14640 [Limisphaerales bacterium]